MKVRKGTNNGQLVLAVSALDSVLSKAEQTSSKASARKEERRKEAGDSKTCLKSNGRFVDRLLRYYLSLSHNFFNLSPFYRLLLVLFFTFQRLLEVLGTTSIWISSHFFVFSFLGPPLKFLVMSTSRNTTKSITPGNLYPLEEP